jgi:hypothetical protein
MRADQQKNVEYFAAIDKEMSHGGVEAMLYDLLQYRFHEVDLRNPPVTDGLVEQKLSSLSSEMSWLYDVLLTGQLSPDSREVWPAEGWMRFDKTTVHQSYADHKASRSKGFVMDRALFGRFLAKSVPGLKEVRPTGVGGARIQMYEFPPLEQIRADFTASTGISFFTDDGERLVDSRTANAKAAEHVEDVDYAGRWNVLSARDFVREKPDTGPNAWFAAAA